MGFRASEPQSALLVIQYLTTSLCKSWPMKNTMNSMALKGLRKPQAIALPASVKLASNSAAETAKRILREVAIVSINLG